MKKVLFLLILLVGIVAAAFIFYNSEPTAQTLGPEANRLLAVYHQTGAKLEDYTLTGWVQLPPGRSEENLLKIVARQAAEKLGAQLGELVETFREDNGFRGQRLSGKLTPLTYVEIFVQTMNYQAADQAETYLLITFYSKDDPGKLDYNRKLINEALKTAGSGAKLATVLKGSFPGQLTQAARENLHAKVFNLLGAQKSEGISSEELVNWSGYSPQLPDRLELTDKIINLNVATRYNSTTNSTMLFIGTPIISIEY
ncbi:MAG: YwmB family TATA-box binding protein [Carboxydocellales bacterium]